jgi:hypothetical protein
MFIVKAFCNEWAGEIAVRLFKFMVSGYLGDGYLGDVGENAT